MRRYRGLTWDHPRGYNALAAAAARLAASGSPIEIVWDAQPLEGFESAPIGDLCASYDLVVLDHPHVGDAVREGCLCPLEEVFTAADLSGWERDTVGPCFRSYRYADRHWALPLDAATQVLALRPDLVSSAPSTWEDVLSLPGDLAVAIPTAGPHPVLTFFSLAVAFGCPPAEQDPEVLVDRVVGTRALDVLAAVYERMPPSLHGLNPIRLLERMARTDDIALCPLVYGYVTYAAAANDRRPIAFHDAPRATAGGRPGSTLGGTGIGISRRCVLSEPLRDHVRWLLGREAQTGFIPAHDGQPSRRDAWIDEAVNARWGRFYRQTLVTIDAAYVRPRHPGYIRFQTEASGILRDALRFRTASGAVLDRLQSLYAATRTQGDER